MKGNGLTVFKESKLEFQTEKRYDKRRACHPTLTIISLS